MKEYMLKTGEKEFVFEFTASWSLSFTKLNYHLKDKVIEVLRHLGFTVEPNKTWKCDEPKSVCWNSFSLTGIGITWNE